MAHLERSTCILALLDHLEARGGTVSNLTAVHAEIGVSYTHLTRLVHQANDAGLVRVERLPDVGRPIRITMRRRMNVLSHA